MQTRQWFYDTTVTRIETIKREKQEAERLATELKTMQGTMLNARDQGKFSVNLSASREARLALKELGFNVSIIGGNDLITISWA